MKVNRLFGQCRWLVLSIAWLTSIGFFRVPVLAAEKVVISYPSRTLTSFLVPEIARQKGFFLAEGIEANLIYVRGAIDIKALVTGDVDYAMASGSAVSAFVAGIPVRLVQGVVGRAEHVLVAQNKYRQRERSQRPDHRLAQPGRFGGCVVTPDPFTERSGSRSRRRAHQPRRDTGAVRSAQVRDGRGNGTGRAAQLSRRTRRFSKNRGRRRLSSSTDQRFGRSQRSDSQTAAANQENAPRKSARHEVYARKPRRLDCNHYSEN